MMTYTKKNDEHSEHCVKQNKKNMKLQWNISAIDEFI